MSKKGPIEPEDNNQPEDENQEEQVIYDDSFIEIDTDAPETPSYLAAKQEMKKASSNLNTVLNALNPEREKLIEDLLQTMIDMSRRTIMPYKDSNPLVKHFKSLSEGILTVNAFENVNDPHVQAKNEILKLIQSMSSNDPNIRPKRFEVSVTLLNIQNNLYQNLMEIHEAAKEQKAKSDLLIIKEIMVKRTSCGTGEDELLRAKAAIAQYNHARIHEWEKENPKERGDEPTEVINPTDDFLKVLVEESRSERELLLKEIILKNISMTPSENDISRVKVAIENYNMAKLVAWQETPPTERGLKPIPIFVSDTNDELVMLIQTVREQLPPKPIEVAPAVEPRDRMNPLLLSQGVKNQEGVRHIVNKNPSEPKEDKMPQRPGLGKRH